MRVVVVLLFKARLHGWLWTSWATSSATPRFRRIPLYPTKELKRASQWKIVSNWSERGAFLNSEEGGFQTT
eukprot:8334070-Alexandrium_andersonii.AAC.1